MKDLRDPQSLGSKLFAVRQAVRETYELSPEQAPASQVYDFYVAHLEIVDYDGAGLMSNDPALHHSKTKQDAPVESDGGE